MNVSVKPTRAVRKRPETALADAFTKAWVNPAEQRLRDIALTAMVTHADDTTAAVEKVWREVREDRDLLVALFDKYGQHRTEIGRLFFQIKRDIAAENSGGAKLGPREAKAMRIIRREREEERREREDQARINREEQARHDREYQEYLASWQRTPIGRIFVGEKPIWQVSVGAVRAWLPTQRKLLDAVERLIEGVPDDGRPIEFYRRPEDIVAIWRDMAE